MKRQRLIPALTACGAAFLAGMTVSNGPTPIGSQWPSEWGADGRARRGKQIMQIDSDYSSVLPLPST